MRTDKEGTITELFDFGECAIKVIQGRYYNHAILFAPAGEGTPAQSIWVSFGENGAPEEEFDKFVAAVKRCYNKEKAQS